MSPQRLSDRHPELGKDELITALVPPPRFDGVRFSTYVPNNDEPSQADAVAACRGFTARINRVTAGKKPSRLRALFGGRQVHDVGQLGLYLDGGFGVGKTHLLASMWHEAPFPKAYGTFVELTHLVGALGFAEAVRRLSEHSLLAIDEFELDDPGDTMLVTRLLRELTSAGVYVAATSNTLPDKLGEGRFAAEDFLREIQSVAERFSIVRVDGPDYRHRGLPDAPRPVSDEELFASAEQNEESTLDEYGELCHHLSLLHPSRYGRLVEDVSTVHLRSVRTAPDQNVALRLVAFVDRLYDRAIPVMVSGDRVSELFSDEMLRGGYRKKYLRAVSRLTALTRDGTPSSATTERA